jgi:hypothetical protein
MPGRRSISRRSLAGAILWAAAATLGVGLVAWDAEPSLGAETQPATSAIQVDEKLVRTTCTGCHAFPPPEILPRDRWRDEIVRMMFIREKRTPPIGPPDTVYKTVQLPADMTQALTFYEAHAPDRLPAPAPWPDPGEAPVRFERRGLAMPEMPGVPAVAHVSLVDFDGDGRLDVLGADMRHGVIFTGRPLAGGTLSTVASIPYPSHVTFTDVDLDGTKDLLVADMGAFFPADHKKGAVIWLRGLGKGKFSAAYWLDEWPRVADAETADFNGDGKNDLAVAAFGWRTTGQVAIVENRTTNPAQPSFAPHTIDPRPGAIHMIPTDLNGDGRMDFVVLLAQEHETVLAYINKGTGDFSFDQKVIYAAPHPNWGSSGIQLVDLDRDRDLDVLLTHGDTWDDGIVKSYHGIQWLENTGGYPFVEHTLAQMAGVHRAVAADIDGDGDLDVAAAALLAGGADADESTLPALVWLEQTTRGTFVRHTIEKGFPRHATLDAGDVDGDGDTDLVVGNFYLTDKRSTDWVEVWANQGKRP